MLGVDAERGHFVRGGRAVGGWPAAQLSAIAVHECVPVASRDSFATVHESQAIAAEVGGPRAPTCLPYRKVSANTIQAYWLIDARIRLWHKTHQYKCSRDQHFS